LGGMIEMSRLSGVRCEVKVEYVYFALASSVDRMKIGYTTGSVAYRIYTLNSASPVEVEAFGYIEVKFYDKGGGGKRRMRAEELEDLLHRHFHNSWVKGEWFVASEIVDRVIRLDGFQSTARVENG